MGKIYVNDIGTEITVDCGSDISSATTLELYVHKPNGKNVTWTCILSGTNYIKYTTVSGDLDQAGEYSIQSHLVLPTWSGSGETATFNVYKRFE